MCLESKNGSFVFKKAKENIRVYKRLEIVEKGKGSSPFHNMEYRKDCHYVNHIDFNRYGVTSGLHAYTSKESAKKEKRYGETITTMIIPAGAYYCVGKNDHIVSTELTWRNK